MVKTATLLLQNQKSDDFEIKRHELYKVYLKDVPGMTIVIGQLILGMMGRLPGEIRKKELM